MRVLAIVGAFVVCIAFTAAASQPDSLQSAFETCVDEGNLLWTEGDRAVCSKKGAESDEGLICVSCRLGRSDTGEEYFTDCFEGRQAREIDPAKSTQCLNQSSQDQPSQACWGRAAQFHLTQGSMMASLSRGEQRLRLASITVERRTC
jgi:hypothetical protein